MFAFNRIRPNTWLKRCRHCLSVIWYPQDSLFSSLLSLLSFSALLSWWPISFSTPSRWITWIRTDLMDAWVCCFGSSLPLIAGWVIMDCLPYGFWLNDLRSKPSGSIAGFQMCNRLSPADILTCRTSLGCVVPQWHALIHLDGLPVLVQV